MFYFTNISAPDVGLLDHMKVSSFDYYHHKSVWLMMYLLDLVAIIPSCLFIVAGLLNVLL